MNKRRVLFLCTGNSARSQMAEAILRRLAGDRFEVHSAGLEPKGINPYTRRVMEEAGYDLSGHTSKDLSVYLGKIHFGHVITVCGKAEKNCPIFPGVAVRMHWPVDDPAEFVGSEPETLEVFRRVQDEIDARIREWLREEGIELAG